MQKRKKNHSKSKTSRSNGGRWQRRRYPTQESSDFTTTGKKERRSNWTAVAFESNLGGGFANSHGLTRPSRTLHLFGDPEKLRRSRADSNSIAQDSLG